MTLRGLITVATVLCFALGLFGPNPAASSHIGKACCTRYNRKPIPFARIRGYREQTAMENCHIEAIIFYTNRNYVTCATRKDEWVRRALNLLSSKLKRMSKTGFAAGETERRKSVGHDGSGCFF
uniref:C-C motif chemokine n=1 Tax=Mola mola TaxID=94237 RepID=A0A3Q4B7D9_MOLML